MQCPSCGADVPPGARYCPSCGEPLPQPELEPDDQRKLTLDLRWTALVLLLSFGLTLMMTTLFHWPVFLFGLFLPFAWLGGRRRIPKA